jgi:hypothetical protein
VILDNSILFGNAPDNRKAKINLESLFKIIWEIIETSSSFVINLNKKYVIRFSSSQLILVGCLRGTITKLLEIAF